MTPVFYRVDATDVLTDFNDRWDSFALDNGAPHLVAERVRGRPLWAFVADKETQELFRNLMAMLRWDGGVIQLPFRCDTPTRRRPMEMVMRAGADGSVEFRCWVLAEEPREPVPVMVPGRDGEKCVTMCSMCKRIFGGPAGWLEAEQALALLPVFHEGPLPGLLYSVCPDCLARALAPPQKG